MDTLYTFWDNITHSKTESVYFLGLINSATKLKVPFGVSFRVPSKEFEEVIDL